ncbi:hypothetical protein LBA_00040 [Megavirus lba]|uniref:Uncharacterized protein n=1 Tax=Megavirus lba TaxID=1235314 RepID=L7Y1M4_9VIRU|nr:hypothetical protein LBA_00040 [Megavirus lba]
MKSIKKNIKNLSNNQLKELIDDIVKQIDENKSKKINKKIIPHIFKDDVSYLTFNTNYDGYSGYDDEDIIGKYGMTKDLDRRTGEYNDTYGQFSGFDFRLTIFNFIDVQYMSQAETDLKLYMKDTDLKFNHNKYIELAIIPKSMLKSVKKQYDLIGKSYIGHIKELTDKIKDKDNEIKLIKKDCDIMKINHENELLKKDLEMMKMENKLLNKKLK